MHLATAALGASGESRDDGDVPISVDRAQPLDAGA